MWHQKRAAGIFEFESSRIVADAVAGCACSCSPVEIRACLEDGVAEDGKTVDTDVAVFCLCGGADVDRRGDVAAWRRSRRASPGGNNSREKDGADDNSDGDDFA